MLPVFLLHSICDLGQFRIFRRCGVPLAHLTPKNSAQRQSHQIALQKYPSQEFYINIYCFVDNAHVPLVRCACQKFPLRLIHQFALQNYSLQKIFQVFLFCVYGNAHVPLVRSACLEAPHRLIHRSAKVNSIH